MKMISLTSASEVFTGAPLQAHDGASGDRPEQQLGKVRDLVHGYSHHWCDDRVEHLALTGRGQERAAGSFGRGSERRLRRLLSFGAGVVAEAVLEVDRSPRHGGFGRP
jgi:hypothetical protein